MTNATPRQTLELLQSSQTPVRRSSLHNFISLALLAVLGLVLIYTDTPPRPMPVSAPAGRFSADRAMVHVEAISKKPHPVGSAEHSLVKQYIVNTLVEAGLSPQVQNATAVSSRASVAAAVDNIVARIPGTSGGKSVLLVAHYDSVATSLGASDDGASVAVLLETARMLRASPQMKHDVVFLFSDGEELGLLGAQAFVAENPLAANVGMVLNFEARGTGGPAILFETSDQNGKLISAVSKTVTSPVANSLSYEIYKRLPNDTDFSVFKRAGYPGLNFAFIDGLVHYHTLMDNEQNLDRGSLQQQGDYAVSLARQFADSGDQNLKTGGSAIYFDILGRKLIHYSSGTGMLLLLMTALLLFGSVAQALKKKSATVMGIVSGLGFVLLALVGAAITSFVMQYLIVMSGPRSTTVLAGEFYNTGAYVASFVIAALGTASLLYIIGARKIGSGNLAMAGLVLWFILLLTITVLAPGGSFLLLWPALMVLAAWNIELYRNRAESRHLPLNLACAAAIVVVVPMAHKIFTAFDFGSYMLVSILLSLLVALCVPQLTEGATKRTWLVPGCLYASAAAVVLAALIFSPRFDRQHPRLDSLIYASNADTGSQVWASYDRQPDQWTAQVLHNPVKRATLPQVFPTSPRLFMQAPAVSLPLAAPELHVIDSKVAGNEHQVHLQVLSPRHGSAVVLFVPADTPVLGATLNGQDLHPSNTAKSGWTLQYFGLSTDGLELTLNVKSEGTLKLQVSDVSDGLPETEASHVSSRPEGSSPLPVRFNDSTIVTKTFTVQ